VTVPGEGPVVVPPDGASASAIDPIGVWLHLTTPGIVGALCPAYLATNSATSIAFWPTTMFCGMTTPENPPFAIAYRTRATGRSQRMSKFGPLLNCAVRTFWAEPWVAA